MNRSALWGVIGVIADERDLAIVEEFFQLFKTPWELWRSGQRYSVVLVASIHALLPEADLIVIYRSDFVGGERRSIRGTASDVVVVNYRGRRFPVYGGLWSPLCPGTTIMTREDTGEAVGLVTSGGNGKTVRIGYNLFGEVRFLLSTGQPVEHARVPTLDLHISILRDLIVDSGLPLAEIPPVPAGCNLILCLTHDVDFVSMRAHRLDRTVLGFVYRATIVSLLRFLKGQLPFGKLVRNFLAVLSLPLIHLGLVRDFLNQFERYLLLEGNRRSTFFLIPYKNVDGEGTSGRESRGRATRYDVDDIGREIGALLSRGCEVGLHGIDAWHDGRKAAEERARVRQATGTDPAGVRMHWLFSSERTPQVLEEAGFVYDATWGYNDAVGFRAGTAQVFRPPGAERLLELPLHVQDAALFASGRMGLSQREGIRAIDELVDTIRRAGGVLTVNWHQRSLGPERLWDDPYRQLLRLADNDRVWCAPAREVAEWFALRRSAVFGPGDPQHKRLRVSSQENRLVPRLSLTIYRREDDGFMHRKDVAFCGELTVDGAFVRS